MSTIRETADTLTPEQIANWRQALVPLLGGYALIMPAEQIQRYRDKMQEWALETNNDKMLSHDR